MSGIPVDKEQNNEDKSVEGQQREKKLSHEATHVSFRVRSDALMFFKRMTNYFYECHLINEPKLSLLAKACLNILAHRYAKQEEINLANYVQRNLAAARGQGVFTAPQIQREQAAKGDPIHTPVKKTVADLIPPRLRRPPPIDNIQEPDWMQGW
jgi:hypothetical protein